MEAHDPSIDNGAGRDDKSQASMTTSSPRASENISGEMDVRSPKWFAKNQISRWRIDTWSSRTPRATAPAWTESLAMPTIDGGWLDQHQHFPPPGPQPSQNSQSTRSDGRKSRFERASTLNWWRRAKFSSRRSLRVDQADRTAAPVPKTSRIARRVPSGDATVNDFCPDAILARHNCAAHSLHRRPRA